MHLLLSSVLIVIVFIVVISCIISSGSHADGGSTTTTVVHSHAIIINDVRNAVACSVCAIRSTCPLHEYDNDEILTGLVNDSPPLCLQLDYSKQLVIDDHQLCDKYFVTCSMGVTSSSEQIAATTFEGTIDTTSSSSPSSSRRHSISASLSTITKQFVMNGMDDEEDTAATATAKGYEHMVLEILNPKLI